MGVVLGSFWNLCGSFWDQFEIVLGSCIYRSEIVLGPFWNRIGIALEQNERCDVRDLTLINIWSYDHMIRSHFGTSYIVFEVQAI